ncbi:MAG TPA: zinc ABC transporter substrate-binding protein [Savagea sp.]
MRNVWKVSLLSIIAVLFLAACSGDDEAKDSTETKEGTNDEAIQVVATFSIIHDILQEVGGEHVDVHSMVPIGTDPHEYEPLPEDIKKATDADALFYNGLNLEGGKDGWFFKLVDTVGQKEENIFEVMEGVEPMYLSSDDGTEEEINPHAFLSPTVGMQMVENVVAGLVEIDPDNKAYYEENGAAFLEELEEIDALYEEKINEIDEDKRILVTSERAFQYMTDRYGLKEGYIWAIDTEENGTPEQIKQLVNFVKENDVPVLFVESNVEKSPMETVSKETGVEIFGEVYSDELGEAGTEGETYTGFLRKNIEVIHAGLTK